MGRTYHGSSSAYVLPNDAPEHERLGSQSKALDAMMNERPIRAPLHNPRKILEVGCGIGIMTRHLAGQHDTALQVIGVDLSPVPDSGSENVTFLQGDFLTLAKEHPLLRGGGFDYIFSRLLVYGVSDWPCYIQQAKDLLAPGGWLELQEGELLFYDEKKNLLPENGLNWIQQQSDALSRRGLDTRCASKLGSWMQAAGFGNISVEEFRWVIGRWRGHGETDLIGEYSVETLSPMLVEMYRNILSSSRTAEQLEAEVKEIKDTYAWADSGKHTLFKVVYGRKSSIS